MRRFERFGELKDVDNAIKHQLEATEIVPDDSPYLSTCLSNLGTSFMRRFERFSESKLEDVDNAINYQL
jgi:hypothetical protein